MHLVVQVELDLGGVLRWVLIPRTADIPQLSRQARELDRLHHYYVSITGKRNPNRHRIYRFNHIHMQILEFYHKDQKSPESIQRFEINTSLLGLSIRIEGNAIEDVGGRHLDVEDVVSDDDIIFWRTSSCSMRPPRLRVATSGPYR